MALTYHFKGVIMNNKVYDVLAFLGRILLPLLATFTLTMGETWGLAHTKEIATTITAVATLLNGILAGLSKQYFTEEIKG